MNEILIDLKSLVDSARYDLTSQRWESYPEYIIEFNRLLFDATLREEIRGLEPIAEIPSKELSLIGPGFGTNAEKAKLREIVSKCDRLIARLSLKRDSAPAEELPFFKDDEVLKASQLNAIVSAVASLKSPIRHASENTQAITAFPLFQKRSLKPNDRLVFVLMPFTESWSEYIWREQIRPIVEEIPDYSLRCLRADDLFGADLMQDIYESIVRARIVIADITNRNANVFYELGMAHTLGKDVILLSQGAQHIPIDLQRFRHCIYSNDGPGYKVLRSYVPSAIRSIIDDEMRSDERSDG